MRMVTTSGDAIGARIACASCLLPGPDLAAWSTTTNSRCTLIN